MATRTGTVKAVNVDRGPDFVIAGEAIYKVVTVDINNESGSSVIGGTDTLRIADLGASIAAWVRDGKTYTLLNDDSVMVSQPAVGSDGTAYYATIAVSSNQLDLSPVAVSDYSTNATLPAGSQLRYYRVSGLFKVS